MSKAVAEIAVGTALVALDIALPFAGVAVSAAVLSAIGSAGASLVIGGIGTLLTKQQQGLTLNTVNPIAPWIVIYGQARVGGTLSFQETTGQSDKYWHRIFTLACHPCQSIDAVYFDGKRVCLDTSGNSLSFGNSTAVIASQQTVNISSISRANNVVTVVMASAMPLPATTAAGPALMNGDTVQIQNVTTDATLNGQYQIQVVNSTTFTYICGGSPVTITNQGQVQTQWPDYGDTVHVEYALGNQTSNPFPGLAAAGDSGSNGLWTSAHAQQGRTAVYVRLKYGGNTYAAGYPNVSFIVSGKNDIYDPRTGGTGYTTNSALCIADFMTNQKWGFKRSYGSTVPTGPLIAAANICDESVTLANGGTEPRYTCNGSFAVSAKRGEILQNMLTSCAGRITFQGGGHVINPGAYTGATVISGQLVPANSSGSPLTAATLTVWASWTPDTTAYGSPIISYSFGSTSGNFNTAGLSGTPSALTYTLSSANLYQTFELAVKASIVGTLGSSDTTSHPAYLKIYDCYISATYQDASTATIRPAATSELSGDGSGIFYSGTQGVVTNPQNAIDADTNPPATYAQIMRDYFGSLATPGYLQLSSFNFPINNLVSATALTLPNYVAGAIQWKPKLSTRDLFNGVKATYVSPLNSWQASDMPPYAQDTNHGYTNPGGGTGYYDLNLTADGGNRRWLDLQFPFTNSVSMAQRIAKIELMRRRYQGSGTLIFNLAMLQMTALDVIAWNFPFFNWTNHLTEVTAMRFTIQKQTENGGMLLGTELDIQDTDPSIYSWSTAEELSPEGYQQTITNNLKTVQTPAGVTVTNSTVAGTGVTQGQLQVTWTAPTDGYVVDGGQVIVQYSLDDTHWLGLGTYDSSVTTAFVPAVAAGQQYWVRVAYINTAGVQGPWTVYGPITATGSSLNLPYYSTSWTSQTSVTVTHNLGTSNVLVQVRDSSNNLVQPQSVTITSANVVTLAFGANFSGSVLVLAL